MVDARQLGHARGDAGGDGDLVVALEVVGLDTGAELDVDAGVGELVPEVAQGLVELLLARDAPRDVELTADVVGRVEERDVVAALGGGRRKGQAGRAGTDDGNPLRQPGRADDQLGLVAGAGVDEAGGCLLYTSPSPRDRTRSRMPSSA